MFCYNILYIKVWTYNFRQNQKVQFCKNKIADNEPSEEHTDHCKIFQFRLEYNNTTATTNTSDIY